MVLRLLRYLFPPGSIRTLLTYGFLFGVPVIAVCYFDLAFGIFLAVSGLTFGAMVFLTVFHPELIDWTKGYPGSD